MAIFFWITATLLLITLALFFPQRLASGIEALAKWFSGFLKQDFSSCVDLEIMVNDHTLMRRDGSLVSVLEFQGSLLVPGVEEYREMVRSVSRFVSRQMNGVGHDIQVVYRQDSGDSAAVIAKVLARSKATASRIGLNMDDVLQAEEETLRRVVVDESIWVVVSTNPSALANPELVKEEREERVKRAVEQKLPPLGFAQNPIRILEELIPKHESFLDEVQGVFNASGKTLSHLMSSHEVVAAMRREIQPLSTSDRFRPCLPGDKPPASTKHYGVREWEDIYYPPIWSQVCNSHIEEIAKNGYERVFVDGLYHGTISVDLPPQTPESFEQLMKKIRDLPFRISFRLYNSGMKRYQFNQTLVQFLAFNPKSDNRSIKLAIDRIREREQGDDSTEKDPALGLCITVTTWHEDEKRMLRNMQTISRALQGWGGCDVLTGAGDPTDLFVSSIPALSANSPARFMLQNGSDVARMLPLTRPAASWRDGAVVFTSLDGKILPFQPGSSVQKAWVYLVFATMGSGKSVLLNTIELGMCLAPGLSKLPMMTILDVGESVSGLISMVESSLPANRKNEVGFFKIKMSPDYAYNVFDLQLGFEYPHARDRDFLRNFLTMLATPAGSPKPPALMSELMGMVVDEAYRQKSSRVNPNKYQSGVVGEIDNFIDQAGIHTDGESTWHELRDELFKRGKTDLAILASRHAVPTLQNIPSVLKSGTIMDVFGRTEDGRNIIETSSLMINSALRDYPVLSMPTRWDIGQARVVGIDLNDVKGHGEAGAKQTALMYAFAQQSAARNYYLHPDILGLCPELYKSYHEARINEVIEEIKAIIYDEFHNTKGIEGIRKIVSTDIREGRKWNIMTVLSSQLLDDFDQDAIENMTGTFILGANGSEAVIEKCRATFGLSQSAVDALKNDVNAPGVGMAIFNTKSGKSTTVFRNHLSPIKMWGFTTTAEDKALRRILYEAMPANEARQLLAKHFPKSGQFKAHVENKRNQMLGSDDDDIINNTARQLIDEWRNRKEEV